MDHVPKEIRSRIMASVKSQGNRTTEQAMKMALRRAGLGGYRKHWPVTGKPDFAWPKLKIALFVDGCFWHGCPRCDRPSKSNLAFWRKKLDDNKQRDKRVSQRLRRAGWSVLRVWECRVDKASTISRIRRGIQVRTAMTEEPAKLLKAPPQERSKYASSGSGL